MRDDLAVNVKQLVGFLGVAVAEKDASGGFGRQFVADVGLAHQEKTFAAKNFGFRKIWLVIGQRFNRRFYCI